MTAALNAARCWTIFTALAAMAWLIPLAASAAPPGAPTTYAECYKSTRSCEKSRCKRLEGGEQVTCMQQCNREYESCASRAASGQPAAAAAQPTPSGKEHRHRHGKKADGTD